MSVLLLTHERYLAHELPAGHPERPERLRAVLSGIEAADLDEAVVPVAPRAATSEEVARVHDGSLIDQLRTASAAGGRQLDPDTWTSDASYDAAVLAAGAGLAAVEELRRGDAQAAFCAVRPPGHHATTGRAMGFCLLNNIAITAARLAAEGERVLIVDYDAHHGNGTQQIFWTDPAVAYVSLHQHPLYPGTGDLREVGEGAGRGTTVNVPLPLGATGDVHRAAVDELVGPLAQRLSPAWLLISAGFDGHRADPLTDLALSAGDFADVTLELVGLVEPGRCIAFLEGGYDLAALASSAAACVAALAGERRHDERPTSGGPGREAVAAAARVRAQVTELG